MSALKQYTDLYAAQAPVIDAHSAPLLNAMRPAALKALEGARLPDRSVEGYEKTSVEEMFAPDYGINVARLNIPVDAAASFSCGVPNLSTLMAFVVNDRFVPARGLADRLPEGVRFMSLARAAEECPELVGKYLGRQAPLADAAVALNTLFCQDGVFIHISRGVRVEKPLQLVQLFSSAVPLAAFRRIVVAVEDDAELKLLLCSHSQNPDIPYLGSEVVEVSLGARARLDICSLEESGHSTSRLSKLYMRQEAESEAVVNSSTLVCGTTRNEFVIDLAARHASLILSGMAIGADTMHIDNNSQVTHSSHHGRSNQLFKYVMDDRSEGAFEGSILVTHDAPFTEAYQSNRNILASGEARMHCKPQLIIYNDEVKCSHGATTGQLSEDAIFYMRQRGIPLKEARTMLMQAFMIDVIDTVRIPGLNDRLRHLVDRRFSGTLGNCEGCRN